MTSIAIFELGDERKRRLDLKPGTYKFVVRNGIELRRPQFVQLKRSCTVEITERFDYLYPALKLDPAWKPVWKLVEHHVDTLTVTPTRWERFKAFVLRRPLVPRAIAITGYR